VRGATAAENDVGVMSGMHDIGTQRVKKKQHLGKAILMKAYEGRKFY